MCSLCHSDNHSLLVGCSIHNTTIALEYLRTTAHGNYRGCSLDSKFYFHNSENLEVIDILLEIPFIHVYLYKRRKSTFSIFRFCNALMNCSLVSCSSCSINLWARLNLHFAIKQFVSAGLRKSLCSV